MQDILSKIYKPSNMSMMAHQKTFSKEIEHIYYINSTNSNLKNKNNTKDKGTENISGK